MRVKFLWPIMGQNTKCYVWLKPATVPLITWLISSLWWSLVVARLCHGDVSQFEVLGDWSGLREQSPKQKDLCRKPTPERQNRRLIHHLPTPWYFLGDSLLKPHTLEMVSCSLDRLTISLHPSLDKFETQLLHLINADCNNMVRHSIIHVCG